MLYRLRCIGGAGIELTGNHRLIIDPARRTRYSRPYFEMDPEKWAKAKPNLTVVLNTHGHIDHAKLIPEFARNAPDAFYLGPNCVINRVRKIIPDSKRVFAPELEKQVRTDEETMVTALHSEHMFIDPITAIGKVLTAPLKPSRREFFPMLWGALAFQEGATYSYVIEKSLSDSPPLMIQDIGSAGATDKIIEHWKEFHKERNTTLDAFLMPIQATYFTDTPKMSAKIAKSLKPRTMFFIHYDDCEPGVTDLISEEKIAQIERAVRAASPNTEAKLMDMSKSYFFNPKTRLFV